MQVGMIGAVSLHPDCRNDVFPARFGQVVGHVVEHEQLSTRNGLGSSDSARRENQPIDQAMNHERWYVEILEAFGSISAGCNGRDLSTGTLGPPTAVHTGVTSLQ